MGAFVLSPFTRSQKRNYRTETKKMAETSGSVCLIDILATVLKTPLEDELADN